MKINKAGQLLVEVASVGFAAMLWTVIFGRAINSPAAYHASTLPIIGPAISSLRAVTNQTYDPAGES